MDEIIYQSHPDVVIATNTFRNVETILQFEDVPLIEVGKFFDAGYTTRFNVYHSDGTHIAVVKGSQIYLTEAGKKASLKTRHEQNLTACELEGKTIIELRRDGPAAIKGWAELHAPEGVFVKATDADMSAIRGDGTHIHVGGLRLANGFFDGQKIGIHVTRQQITIGGGGRSARVEIGRIATFRSTGGGKITFGESDVRISGGDEQQRKQ